MRSFNQLFYTFCLCLTLGISWAYYGFSAYFNSDWETQRETSQLRQSLEDSEFQANLLRHQMQDLEQTVATVLPKEKLSEKPIYRDLMVNLRAPASIPHLDLSSVIMERGKKLFADGKFEPAGKEFEKVRDNYPSSASQIQARFFLAESLFLQREFKKCVDVIDEMVLQYPDQELTGFILLRLGQISEHNNQIEEAQEIYRTVLTNFKQEPLKKQASVLLKSTEIQ